MKTDEDLQEKYKDHQKTSVDQNVPLAADAAHLLSEYLDTLAVEFVKQGIAEPFSIVNQYEEMILNTLKDQANGKKMTLEVVNKILEQFGNPIDTVHEYIDQNQPRRKLILSRNESRQTGSEKLSLYERRGTDKDLIYSLALIGLSTMIIISIFDLISTLFDVYYKTYGEHVTILIIAFIASIIELSSGATGISLIGVDRYKQYRSIQSFIIWFSSIFYYLSGSTFSGNERAITASILPAIIYQSAILLRDHGPGFYPLEPDFKPWVRFLTPSYILFGISSFILFSIVSLNIGPRAVYYGIFVSWIMLFSFGMGFVGMIFDIKSNYPVSIRKNLLILLQPYAFYLFLRQGYLVENLSANIYFIFLTWFIIYLGLIFLVYKKQLNSSLDEYRLKLKGYEVL